MMTTRHALVETTLGEVTLVAEGNDLTGLYFPGHWRRPDDAEFGLRVNVDADDTLSQARFELDSYLAGKQESFDVPLRTHGDGFQERVWSLLKEIPYGATTTYGQLAKSLGDKSLAQRVGQAVGSNPLCVFIPCHRVLGAGGKLTGYAGGLARKRTLLELEEPVEATAKKLL